MILPIGHEAREEIGASKKGTIRRRFPTDDNVIAPARARVTSVEHEFLGAKAGKASLLVEGRGTIDELFPTSRWVNIDLDNSGIGGDFESLNARVKGSLITFNNDF